MIGNPVWNKTPFIITVSAGVFAFIYAAVSIETGSLGRSLLPVILVVVLTSIFTHIRISRSRIYLTLSEVLVFVWFLAYGSAVTVLLATVGALLSAATVKRPVRELMGSGSILLNGAVAAVATLFSTTLAPLILDAFGGGSASPQGPDITLLVTFLVAFHFLAISLFWAVFAAENPGEGFWKLWYENCLNGLGLYAVGGLAAGITARASFPEDSALILATLALGLVIYFTYRRYDNDLKSILERVSRAERRRALQATNHIESLQRQIKKLEETEEALSNSEKRLQYASYHDQRTELPNRSYLISVLRESLSRRRKKNENFALLLLGINLETVRESLGSSLASSLGKRIAKRLMEMTRESDFIASVSQDEFAILLNGVSDIGDAVHFTKLTSRKLAAPFNIDDRILFASVNVGIVFCGNADFTEEELLRNSQIAMSEARSGEKTYVAYDEEMHTSIITRLQIETDLRKAIEEGQLRAYYQPIVNLGSMELMGFEALVRWQHPVKGLIGPGEFITVGEEAGLVLPITGWMLKSACRSLSLWQAEHEENEALLISVNLSGKDFAQDDLVDQVVSTLKEENVSPNCIKLEITESAIMDDSAASIATMEHFKRVGFKLSIDDFGTGYSSLSYLHKFPVDTLKIDQSFVSTMEIGSENGEIVRTVISLAKSLDMNIIAEGIESIHQLHQLRVLGCDYGQGYLFSPPVSEEEAGRILNDRDRWKNMANRPGYGQYNKDAAADRIIQLGDV